METVEILLEMPTVEAYCGLREACGWPVPAASACEKALGNSLIGVVAVEGGRTVGMGRIVGDGALWNYVQDLIVLPSHQRKGIGKRLMEALIARLAEEVADGSEVALISAPQAIGFYEGCGFAICPPEKPGMRREVKRG